MKTKYCIQSIILGDVCYAKGLIKGWCTMTYDRNEASVFNTYEEAEKFCEVNQLKDCTVVAF